jgi:hypothetical protein
VGHPAGRQEKKGGSKRDLVSDARGCLSGDVNRRTISSDTPRSEAELSMM